MCNAMIVIMFIVENFCCRATTCVFNATALMTGLVQAVRFDGGNAMLIVNGSEITFANVLEISLENS